MAADAPNEQPITTPLDGFRQTLERDGSFGDRLLPDSTVLCTVRGCDAVVRNAANGGLVECDDGHTGREIFDAVRAEINYEIHEIEARLGVSIQQGTCGTPGPAAELLTTTEEPSPATACAIGLTGLDLRALADQPDPTSALPGFLDPEPSLHLLHGAAKTGKTTLAWLMALAWGQGLAPWPNAPKLPGSRVLILSAEQGTRKCLRVLRRVTGSAHLGTFEGWVDRLSIVGRHRGMTEADRALLTLDDTGIDTLRATLEDAAERGEPFGLVVADSLSRLKPGGADFNNNDDMLNVLVPLAAVCQDHAAYMLLIHHAGHSAERRGDPINGVRGASAIRDVPQALWAIDRVEGDVRRRLVRVAGNELADGFHDFDVSQHPEPEGHVNRFDPVSSRPLEHLEAFADGPLNLSRFGRTALGWAPDKEPSGAQKKRARSELRTLVERGVVRKRGDVWERVDD